MRTLLEPLKPAILTVSLAVAALAVSAAPVQSSGAVSSTRSAIAWDATEKSVDVGNGQDSAQFTFSFTNLATKADIVLVTNYSYATNFATYRNKSFWKVVSGHKYVVIPELVTNTQVVAITKGFIKTPVTVLSVQPSSGCATPDVPSKPWLIPPGANNVIRASVNLAGESGTVVKTITVTTDQGRTDLTLRVNIPPAPPQEVAEAPLASGGSQGCIASWAFDQNSGNTVTDTSGNGHDATVVGDNLAWIKSTHPGGSGLRMDGSDFAEVQNAVVNTAQSFSVSAWVSLDKIEAKKYQTFVSIDGNDISGFYLQFNPYAGGGAGRFEFDRMQSDMKSAPKISAKAKASISTKTWYHLVGVYDADAKNISIYLNGKLQESVPYTGGWQATGRTAIGRGLSGGHDRNFLTGVIHDVRFYASALTANEIKKLAKSTPHTLADSN